MINIGATLCTIFPERKLKGTKTEGERKWVKEGGGRYQEYGKGAWVVLKHLIKGCPINFQEQTNTIYMHSEWRNWSYTQKTKLNNGKKHMLDKPVSCWVWQIFGRCWQSREIFCINSMGGRGPWFEFLGSKIGAKNIQKNENDTQVMPKGANWNQLGTQSEQNCGQNS